MTGLAYRRHIVSFSTFIYAHPVIFGTLLSLLSSLYLINDYVVVNRSALLPLWHLAQGDKQTYLGVTGQIIAALSQWLDISLVDAGHVLMMLLHALITAVLMLIAGVLNFALPSRWALLFLLLAHPNYNDYRTYIIAEPLFWLLWLSALLVLLIYHRRHSVFAIVAWLVIFLLATTLTAAAWFWLLLFPFGALAWKPWRRKSVAYALIAYAVLVGTLLFLPLYQGDSPLLWFIDTMWDNPGRLASLVDIRDSNWVKEENRLMAVIFVVSGAGSLVVIRTLIALGMVCSGLTVYAVMRKLYRIIDKEQLRIVQYAIIFDVLITVTLFIIDAEQQSILAFSSSLLLLFFAALGLSYIWKKAYNGSYSSVSVLVIIWCLVAYVATGYIIFGPRKAHIKIAAEVFVSEHPTAQLYSNDNFFLFYSHHNPDNTISPYIAEQLNHRQTFFYAYEKNRNRPLPKFLASKTPLYEYHNRHGDALLIYELLATQPLLTNFADNVLSIADKRN